MCLSLFYCNLLFWKHEEVGAERADGMGPGACKRGKSHGASKCRSKREGEWLVREAAVLLLSILLRQRSMSALIAEREYMMD